MPRVKLNQIHKDDLTRLRLFVKSQSNYFGNIGGTSGKPHLHISGTTSALTSIVTITNFSYTTTAGGRNNVNLLFSSTWGYQYLSERWYDRRYNDLIEHVNSYLYTRLIP